MFILSVPCHLYGMNLSDGIAKFLPRVSHDFTKKHRYFFSNLKFE